MRSERLLTTAILVVFVLLAAAWMGNQLRDAVQTKITDRLEAIQETAR